MRLKFDGFIVGLILMIIAAYFYPDLEILMEGRLMSTVISFGVALIFSSTG